MAVLCFLSGESTTESGRVTKKKKKERKKGGKRDWNKEKNETVIKSPDKRVTVLCRSWYHCYLSVFFFFSLCKPFCCFLSPYLAAPKCQEQKGEKQRNYRADYSWGLADKMLMAKIRQMQVIFVLFLMCIKVFALYASCVLISCRCLLLAD